MQNQQPRTDINFNLEALIEQRSSETLIIDNNVVKRAKYNHCHVRYTFEDGTCLLCADDLFGVILEKKKYNQLAYLKEQGVDAYLIDENGAQFFSIDKVNNKLLDYSIQKATFIKKPEDFKAFIDFMLKGGMNQIAVQIGIEADFAVKDLGFLGIDTFIDSQDKSNTTENEGIKTAEEIEAEIRAEIEAKLLEHQKQAELELQEEAIIEAEKQAAEKLQQETIQQQKELLQFMQQLKEQQESISVQIQSSEILADANLTAISENVDKLLQSIELVQKQASSKAEEVEIQIASLQHDKAANQSILESLIEAIQSIKESGETNLKQLADAQKVLSAKMQAEKQEAENKAALAQTLADEANHKLQVEINAAKAIALQASQTDALRERFTNEKIWLRIAIAVTAIFLPFTFLGLHKYIAIETPNFFMSAMVGILCLAIACVWDGAIFLFTINGKKELAAFGSFVQFIFFCAKFDFIAIIGNDMGFDGFYIQKMAVICCAVIYSPLLLNQISDLATKNIQAKSN